MWRTAPFLWVDMVQEVLLMKNKAPRLPILLRLNVRE